jgi:hypothetical protein
VSNTGGPDIDSLIVHDTFCPGSCYGSAMVWVSGGSGNFVYDWSNGVSGNDTSIINLCVGSYSVTVTDTVTGCITIEIFTVGAPLPLVLTMSSTDDHGSGDGTATVIVSGGVPPYTFIWNDPLTQTDSIANNLVNGNYCVTVTDNNGCTATACVDVNLYVSVIETASGFDATLYPNPTSGELHVRLRNTLSENEITIYLLNSLGETVLVRKGTAVKGSNIYDFDLSTYAPGVYYVRLVHNNGGDEGRFKVIKTQ